MIFTYYFVYFVFRIVYTITIKDLLDIILHYAVLDLIDIIQYVEDLSVNIYGKFIL